MAHGDGWVWQSGNGQTDKLTVLEFELSYGFFVPESFQRQIVLDGVPTSGQRVVVDLHAAVAAKVAIVGGVIRAETRAVGAVGALTVVCREATEAR